MTDLRLGTRGSPLALYQAHTVADAIRSASGHVCEIVVIRTSGDRLAEASLSDVGGKRLFVKEIEDALLASEIDLAVHSSKDMPVVLPPGLDIAAVLAREDPRDALVLPAGVDSNTIEAALAQLPRSSRIGTSSVRRVSQLSRLIAGATFLPIRGNLDTRLRKLDEGGFDAIVLAAAGLTRLERAARISARIPIEACVPAPGQGIIAIEIRDTDHRLRDILTGIDDPSAHLALDAERSVVTTLGGGCQMPIGAHASVEGDSMMLTALVASLDGTRIVRRDVRGDAREAEALGTRIARQLLDDGAGEILADVERTQNASGGQPR